MRKHSWWDGQNAEAFRGARFVPPLSLGVGMPDTFLGGCKCGLVRYSGMRADAPMFRCHCRDCQQLTGSGHSEMVPLIRESFEDGGVRSGLDVFRALSQGASGVMIGRPWAYAVAARGETGVVDLVAAFKREMDVAMALSGVTGVSEICRSTVCRRQ